MYYIRDINGVLKAKIPNSSAKNMMDAIKGKFVEKNYSTGKETAFEILEDTKWTYGELQFFIWSGDILISDTK